VTFSQIVGEGDVKRQKLNWVKSKLDKKKEQVTCSFFIY